MSRQPDSSEPAGRGLFAPVEASSLAFFRIAFGIVMLWEVVRYFQHGWIVRYFVEPTFHFTYSGFHWVKPWPAAGMNAHFVGLGVCALAIAVGYRLRLAASLFFFGFAYVFLLEKARYMNHFYLVMLLAGLLAVLPADRVWSWAARRGRERSAPAWGLFLARTQIGLVYLFAGIAKLNADWLDAQPLEQWLGRREGHAVLGPLVSQAWSPMAFAYGGLALDLLAWPLLSFRRTRELTFLALCSFHVMNAMLFNIGIFPWLMIALTTIFFEPGWPRRLLGRFRSQGRRLAPSLSQLSESDTSPRTRRLVGAFLVVYLGFQFLFPLRHHLYPGNVSWTEEGHAFAWHMKLRDKWGQARFHVLNPVTDEEWIVDTTADLMPWQASKMTGRPGMILQYAHHLAEQWEPELGGPVEVRAHVTSTLNARHPQLIVDPTVDLAQVRWGLGPSDWIVPLEGDD